MTRTLVFQQQARLLLENEKKTSALSALSGDDAEE
jgi:hypothetical protein